MARDSAPAGTFAALHRGLARLERLLGVLVKWLLVVTVAAMVLIVVLQVVARFLLIPIIWTSEATQNLMIWLTFIGGAAAFAQGEHIAVELLVARCRPRLRAAVGLLVHLLLLAFFVVLAVYGWRLAIINLPASGYTLPISQFYVSLAVPVGMALVALTAVTRIVGILAGEVPTPSDPVEAAQ
jgi:TRAP-type C4-dicarboxylate transport system permease small subunit